MHIVKVTRRTWLCTYDKQDVHGKQVGITD